MKNRLIYQTTRYDCGPTSITNAIRFLFEREEIPPIILKYIWTMGIDTFADDGTPGKSGTSKASMRYMAAWFECYAQKCGFPLKVAFLDSEYASVAKGSLVWRCLEEGGCALVRCWHRGNGHYVLLTELISDEWIGLFDPFEETLDADNPNIRPVEGDPKRKNRIVKASVFNHADVENYAMGEPERREVLLFWRLPQG